VLLVVRVQNCERIIMGNRDDLARQSGLGLGRGTRGRWSVATTGDGNQNRDNQRAEGSVGHPRIVAGTGVGCEIRPQTYGVTAARVAARQHGPGSGP